MTFWINSLFESDWLLKLSIWIITFWIKSYFKSVWILILNWQFASKLTFWSNLFGNPVSKTKLIFLKSRKLKKCQKIALLCRIHPTVTEGSNEAASRQLVWSSHPFPSLSISAHHRGCSFGGRQRESFQWRCQKMETQICSRFCSQWKLGFRFWSTRFLLTCKTSFIKLSVSQIESK